MGQRVAKTAVPVRRRPHLLVEDPNASLEGADFSAFRDAGFDVTICGGPERRGQRCPLVLHGVCGLAADADVVLFGRGIEEPGSRAILRSLRARFPETPVVVRLPVQADPARVELPHGCVALAFAASVEGEIGLLWKTLGVSKAAWGRARRGGVTNGTDIDRPADRSSDASDGSDG